MADELRRFALAFPGAIEEHPWGESAIKVNRKVFVFLSVDPAGVHRATVKLPSSAAEALKRPFAMPTGYGLGKSGWVTLTLGAKSPPQRLLKSWIEESYRAIAPAKLVARLDGDDVC